MPDCVTVKRQRNTLLCFAFVCVRGRVCGHVCACVCVRARACVCVCVCASVCTQCAMVVCFTFNSVLFV